MNLAFLKNERALIANLTFKERIMEESAKDMAKLYIKKKQADYKQQREIERLLLPDDLDFLT